MIAMQKGVLVIKVKKEEVELYKDRGWSIVKSKKKK